jgi:tetratricopeptide (TPR) repeat protein
MLSNNLFMTKVLIFFFSFALVLSGFSCSRNAASNSDASNSAGEVSSGQTFTDANAALAEGSRLLDANEAEAAINALKQATELNPDLAEAYFKLGIAYSLIEAQHKQNADVVEPTEPSEKGKKPKEIRTESEKAFEKAVEAYKRIIDKNPSDDVAYFNLGRAYNKLNEDEDAEKALRQAVKLKPDDTEYQTELGAILVKLAKYSDAVVALKKALDLDSENSQAQELLDKAEAGKKRIDYATVKKDEKASNSNKEGLLANTNEAVPANVGKMGTPEIIKKPTPPANKPQ